MKKLILALIFIHNIAFATSETVIDVRPGSAYGAFSSFGALTPMAGDYLLTFDDGPIEGITEKIVDILLEKNASAVFFMIGSRAQSSPNIINYVKNNGFKIGSHSFTHRNLTTLPLSEAVDDIQAGIDVLKESPHGHFFRFPEFKFTKELLQYTQNMNLVIFSADISPADWRGSPPEQTFARFTHILNGVDRGIIVLHANQRNTIPLLPMIINEVRERGGRFVDVDLIQEPEA